MDFKKKENSFFIGLVIVTTITLPLVATQNIDCKGKAFHCVNSTHFKICVDLGGGVSTTVDDFLIPCPKSTVCKNSNYFECEYHPTTTLKPTQLSEVTNDQISEIPALENFDLTSTFNDSISGIELSGVIISTTHIPDSSFRTLATDSVIVSENVTSVSDSATYNNIIIAVTKLSSNDEDSLSTTTEKVILNNTELNLTEPMNYTSNLLSFEKVRSTDNNGTGPLLNTYLPSDVYEQYPKNYIENITDLLNSTLTNHIDEDNFNHTSLKNVSYLVPSSENISTNKTTNIPFDISTTTIELISSTEKIVNNFSTETALRSSLYDGVTEQNTVTSSINILSTISQDQLSSFKVPQSEIGITTDRQVSTEYYQEKLFQTAKNDTWEENTAPESKLVANSFNDLNKNYILPSNNKTKYTSSNLSPIIEYLILYHNFEDMPTTTESRSSFPKERVVIDINDPHNLTTFNYESTTMSSNNYLTGHSREKLNISTQSFSETLNYTLTDLQLSTFTASDETISFKGYTSENSIYNEINNVSSLPNTVSKSESAIETLNDETKQINFHNDTSKYDQDTILTHTESILKTDRTEATEFIGDNLQMPTTVSHIEFSNKFNLVQNPILSTMHRLNNSIEFAGNTFIELQANTKNATLYDENSLQPSTVSVKINMPDINATNIYNVLPVIDKPVATHTTIINVSDTAITAGTNSSREDKTNIEIVMYDSEKISSTVNTLVAVKYPSSIDLNVTSNIKIVNNIESGDQTVVAGITEAYVRTSNTNNTESSSLIFKRTTIRDTENVNIDTNHKINTIITGDLTESNISIPGGTGVSKQTNKNVINQEKGYMYINNDINMRNLSTEVKPDDKETESYVNFSQSTPISNQTQNNTITMEVINNNNRTNILTFNDTDVTLGVHLPNKTIPDINLVRSTNVNWMEYNNNVNNVNVNTSNQINMQIFNGTNKIYETYETTDLVINDSINSILNIDRSITEKELIDLNFENKAPNNFDSNGEEIKIGTAVSSVNGSQGNFMPIHNDFSQVNFIEKDNVIQPADKNIQTYDPLNVKHDKSLADTMNVSFINITAITVHPHKNILLNNTKLKTDIIESDVSSTEASVNSLTTETYSNNKTRDMIYMANDTANNINHGTLATAADVNITLESVDNIRTNNTNKVEFLANSTDSDVTTEWTKVTTLNSNIVEVKEMKIMVDAAIPDLNYTKENMNTRIYNNTLPKQLNISDKIILDKNFTDYANKTMQTHYNMDLNVSEHIKFELDTSKADLNLENYKNSQTIESSKFIAEHTILGFNITQSTDTNLNTESTTRQKTYNNTSMQDMIFMSNITVLNKSEGNTTENNIFRVKGIQKQPYPKDTANQTHPRDIENQILKFRKLRSNQTSTIDNNLKMPYISKLEESKSNYSVIFKAIDTDSGENAKNKPNFTSDAPHINDFTIPSTSVISNSNYYIESTLDNPSAISRPLPKVEFKNDLETLNYNNDKFLNNKTSPEINDDKNNFNRIFETNITTPSSKIKPIDIVDYVTNIKVTEEVSEVSKYLEMPSSNKNKQWTVTNTEKSASSQSDYFVQNINVSLMTPFTCNEGIRGKYSDRNDCNKFYICIGKLTPIIGRCPADTVFSEINKQCTKNLSHCVRNNQFKCLAEGRFIDVLSDNFYYICAKNSNGFVKFKLKCQEGYRLSTDTIHCTIKPTSNEDNSKITNEKSTQEKLSSESDKSKKSFVCEKEGLFEFPDDCRKYFHCTKQSKSEFRRKIKKCDSDEVFDKDKQKCVDEDSHEDPFLNGCETLNSNNNKELNKTVSETSGDKRNLNQIFKPNTSTPSSQLEPNEIIDSYLKNIKLNEEMSEDNRYIEKPFSNKKKQWTVTNTEKSVFSQSDYFVPYINVSLMTPFTCNEGIRGKYADKNDCNKFYICIGKLIPNLGRCPADTVFSEINKQCTKNLSHCVRNNQFKCLAEGRFIDVLSNNSYYICTKDSKGFVRFKLKCQEGYHLNTDSIQCHLKQISIEDDSKLTREKSSMENLSSESDKSKKSFACEKEGLFEFPYDCRKYFLCTKKSKSEFRRKIKECDSDEIFDKDKQTCVDDSYESK